MYALLSSAVLALATLPAVQAHMAAWHPSGYGFNKDWEAATPLAGKSFNDWWFHGYRQEKPKEVLSLTPGTSLTMEIACSKESTTYGRRPNSDACPNDAGSYHAGGSTGSASGWAGNDDSNLYGCALAIAYKSNVWDVNPEDFIVMSVQERCVRQRDTQFEIPANLPACPDGECTCAWFWAGKNSATEMYMQGFRCNVEGGVVTNSLPKPIAPRKNKVAWSAVQPFYFANDVNNLGFEADWGSKPSYNPAWGFKNGAQTAAFEGLGGNGGHGNGNGNGNDGGNAPNSTSSAWNGGDGQSSTDYAGAPSSTSSRTRRPRPTTTSLGGDWYNHVATGTGASTSTGISTDAGASASASPIGESSTATVSSASTKPTGKKCKRSRSLRSRSKSHKARGLRARRHKQVS